MRPSRVVCFSLVFLVFVCGCGEQPSLADEAVDQVWLGLAGTGRAFEVCTTFDEDSTRTMLEMMLVDDHDLGVEEVPAALTQFEQRCEALTG